MTSNNLPFDPYNDKFNIEQTLLKLSTTFNKITYFSNNISSLSQEYDYNMKQQSKNTFMYYFNKIRIYYLNHKRSNRQLKTNISNFKKDVMKHIQSNKSKHSKQSEKTNKSPNDSNLRFGRSFTYTYNIQNSNLTPYQSFIKDLEYKINNYQNQQFQKNLENLDNLENSSNPLLIDNQTNRTFLKNYIQKNKTNKESIYKSRKLFKKLYRKISVKTHPDKIKKYSKEKQEFYTYLFLKSKRAYKEHIYYILILIAVILNITTYKLHWPDKCMLDMEIENIVKSRIENIRHKLFNYDTMNEESKNKIIDDTIKTMG